jgi:hypothetical protein
MKLPAPSLSRLLAVSLAAASGALVLSAQAEPIGDRQRAQAAQVEAFHAQRLERAAENCRQNRGTDCSSPEGLQEWLLLDRSRAEAVLDRVLPSASAVATLPPPANPQTSPGEPRGR